MDADDAGRDRFDDVRDHRDARRCWRTTKDPQEELAVLEAQIQGAAAVVVDIYSRYLFEKEVFERRAQAELSADDFCEIMERAQKATYGDGLDERYLQKFMWTWKPHYYSPALSFYNFPYAFGLLFATGLYAIYQQRGPAFVDDYKKLLASTGEANAADLAKRFGIDIRTRKFWDDSLAIIGRQVDRFCEIQSGHGSPRHGLGGGSAPSEEAVRQLMRAEDLAPYSWGNGPFDRVHGAHALVQQGHLCGPRLHHLRTARPGWHVELKPGDRLDLPRGHVHDARVGGEGVTCLEAHKE